MTSLSNSKPLPAISPDDEQALHAYVDGELSGAEGRALEARLSSEPGLRAHLDEIRAVGRWFTLDAEREMRALPPARFEQLWDELDGQLAREAAALRPRRPAPESEAEAAGGWVAAWWARLRWPVGAVAVAAAAVVVFSTVSPSVSVSDGAVDAGGVATSDPTQRPNQSPRATGEVNEPGSEPGSAPGSAPSPEPDLRIADAARGAGGSPPVGAELPAPDSNDADIERIEFGGASGQISRIEGVRGTTTVIWVEEDDQPADTERSL